MNHIASERESVFKTYRLVVGWKLVMTNANWSQAAVGEPVKACSHLALLFSLTLFRTFNSLPNTSI